MEELEYREVPSLISRRLNGVTSNVAEGTQSGIGKCTCVEPCGRGVNPVGGETALRHQYLTLWIWIARHDARPVRVPDLIRTLGDSTGAAIRICEVAVRIEHRKPVAAGHRYDICNLPASDHLVRKPARASHKMFAVAKRQLVN